MNSKYIIYVAGRSDPIEVEKRDYDILHTYIVGGTSTPAPAYYSITSANSRHLIRTAAITIIEERVNP